MNGAAPLPPLLLQGLDSLYVSYCLDVATSGLDLGEIAYRREKLRSTRDARFARIELGSESFALKPNGRYPYSYVIDNAYFSIGFAERMQPSFYVQYSSKGLWELGIDELEHRFRRWTESVGLTELRADKVARADWAFDFHLPVVDFTPDHVVSRSRKNDSYRENQTLQTIRYGRNDIVVRLYDKVAEIEQSSDKSFFFELWGRRADVWRVEFQIRGERLKQAGIQSLDSLRALQSDLLRELAHSHTTLRRPSRDSNPSRWPLHPLWQAVQKEIACMPQSGLVRQFDEKRHLAYRIHRQAQALHGNLKGLAALLSIAQQEDTPLSLAELIDQLPDELTPHHDPLTWETDVNKRIEGYALGQW